MRQNRGDFDRKPEFLEPDRENGTESLDGLLHQLVEMLEGVDIDPRLLHGPLDPGRGVRMPGLGIDRIPGYERDDLPALLLDHLLALIGREMDLSLLDDPFRHGGKISGLEDLHERFVGSPGCLRGIAKDIERCYNILDIDRLALPDEASLPGIHKNLEPFPVTFEPGYHRMVKGDHG